MDTTGLPSNDTAEMLRNSLRGFLEAHWAAGGGKERASPDDIYAIWGKLVGQGVAALGSDRDEGGLREILVVMTELGRAGCPAPMWSAALANFALSGSPAVAAVELLEGLHVGTAVAAFCFGVRDPDAGTGSICIDGRYATGVLRFVEVAGATHILVAVDDSRLGLVRLDAPGVVLTPMRTMGAWGLCEVRLNSVPLTLLQLESTNVDDLRLEAQAALLGRAYGAARRAFELAVDYAKERHQFGQPIGRFQAIQHKLANGLIALEGVRLTWITRPGCTTLVIAIGAISPIARLPSAATRCAGVARDPACVRRHRLCRGARAPRTLQPRAPGHDRARRGARCAAAAGLVPAGRRRRALPEYDLGPAGNALRERGARWLDQNWSATARLRSTNSPFTSASSTPTSRAISARPAGSASAGQRSSAARRVRRWSRSHSWR